MPIRQLGRSPKHRKALFRNLATALILNDRITTTHEKAKEMRPLIEKLVRKSKRGQNEDHRFINQKLFTTKAMKRLNTEIAPRFEDLDAGFTRVEYLGRRNNDKARMAMIEFTKNPIREYEKNEEALEKEDFDLKSFWQWEMELLE
jgi:large subunit ribosomal protein L17